MNNPKQTLLNHQKTKNIKKKAYKKKANNKKKKKRIWGKKAECRLQSALRRTGGNKCAPCTLSNKAASKVIFCLGIACASAVIKTTKDGLKKNAK